MKQNESGLDRIARLVGGTLLTILGLFVFTNSTLGLIMNILGVVLLLTGMTGFCLIYKLFNFSTKIVKD
jgi:hypothetical protein